MKIKTLAAKVFIYFALSTAAIVCVFGFATYLMIRADLEKEMEGRLFMAAGLIKENINASDLAYLGLKGGIYSSYEEKLASLRKVSGVSNIALISKDSKPLLSLESDFYMKLDSYEISRALSGKPAASPLYRGAMNRYYKSVYIPISGGVLAVEASVMYEKYLNRYRVSLAVAGIMALALALLVSFFITSGVTRSIRRLKQKAEAIGRREFNSGIKAGGEEEIRVLALTLESMEKELVEYIREKEKMAAVGEFSAGVAHEIRNSLATLSGYAELIMEKTADDKIRKYGADIYVNAMKMSSFLNNFLDYTKQFKPEFSMVDAGLLCSETIDELPAGVKQAVLYEKPAEEIKGQVDVYLLKKALFNIIMNAYQAMDKEKKEIIVAVEPAEKGFSVTVRDNGKGIPAGLLGRIFQPFFTGRKEGTGLGLAIAYRIIREIHGGDISVESREGEGTKVTILIKNAG